MQTLAQKTMNDLKGFAKMLDDIEHMNGLTPQDLQCIYPRLRNSMGRCDWLGWCDKAVE